MASVGTATFTAVADFSSVKREADKAGTALDGLGAKAKQTNDQVQGVGDTSAKTSKGVQSGWSQAASSMQSAGTGMTLGMTLPLVGLAAVGAKTFSDFETGLAKIQANTGASAAEMEKMRAKAIQMGADTSFTATDAANSLYTLTAAGMSTNEAMGAIDGTMLLAAATGTSLADSTDLVAKTMAAFSLKAADAGHIADVMTQATNQTSASMKDLQEGMTQAGQLGATYGQSLENVVGGLAALVSQGIPAASAGTGLRQALDSLAAPGEKAAGMMKKLGINVRDSKGNMKQLPDVVAELEKGLKGLAPAQRDATLQAIFGVEGAKAMALSMNAQYKASTKTAQGADAVAKITQVMGKEWVAAHMRGDELVTTGSDAIRVLGVLGEKSDGTAKQFDKVMSETSKRKWEEMKGSMENLMITAGTVLAPLVTKILKLTTAFLNWADKMAKAHPLLFKIVLGVLAFLAVAGPLLVITAKVIQAAMFLKTALFGVAAAEGVVGKKGLFGRLAQMVVWLGRTALAAGRATVALLAAAAAGAKDIAVGAWSALTTGLKNAALAAWGLVRAMGAALLAVIRTTAAALAQAAAWVISKAAMLAGAIASGVATAAQWLLNIAMYANPIGLIILAVIALIAIIWLLVANWDKVSKWLGTAWNWLKKVWLDTWNAIKNAVMQVWVTILNVIRTAFNAIRTVVSTALAVIRTVWNTVWGGLTTAVRTVWNTVKSIIQNVIVWIKRAIDVVMGPIKRVAGWVRDLFKKIGGLPSKVLSWFGFAEGGIVPGSGSGDTVPALLTPGEAVIPKDVVKRLGKKQMAAMIAGKAPQMVTVPGVAKVNTSNVTNSPTTNVVVNNPVPEKASDTLPRVIRRTVMA